MFRLPLIRREFLIFITRLDSSNHYDVMESRHFAYTFDSNYRTVACFVCPQWSFDVVRPPPIGPLAMALSMDMCHTTAPDDVRWPGCR